MKRQTIRSVGWATTASFAVLAFGALSFRHQVEFGASGPLYLLLILLVSWRAGFRASIPVVLSATLGLDYFYTEPRLTLRMASPTDVFAVTSFLSVAILVSHLSHRVRLHAEQTKREELKHRMLYELSRSVILIDWKADVGEQLCELIQTRCRLRAVALWNNRESRFSCAGDGALFKENLEASYRAASDYDLPSRAEHIRMLRFGTRNVGSIALRGELDALMADSIATLVATNLERIRALNAEVSAESQALSEQLRTTVLDGLAHAVKTPLTTILLSASGLREAGSLTALQARFAETIETQSAYLADLTTQLLRTAKLDDAAAVLMRDTIDLETLLEDALDELSPHHDVKRVHVTFPSNAIVIDADVSLVRMAMMQVLENALKYSPSGSRVRVCLSCDDADASISVHNEGTFVPMEERARIFERYYRSPSTEHRASGTGVGLSVTKRAVEAHGGHVRVASSIHEGTTFVMTLPRKE